MLLSHIACEALSLHDGRADDHRLPSGAHELVAAGVQAYASLRDVGAAGGVVGSRPGSVETAVVQGGGSGGAAVDAGDGA